MLEYHNQSAHIEPVSAYVRLSTVRVDTTRRREMISIFLGRANTMVPQLAPSRVLAALLLPLLWYQAQAPCPYHRRPNRPAQGCPAAAPPPSTSLATSEGALTAAAAAAAASASSTAAATWMGQVPHASDASDPLVQLNNLFHSQYTASGVAVRPPVYIIIEVCTVAC